MRKFWCVQQRFYDNGKVKVSVYSIEAESKPIDSADSKAAYDEYKDYFSNKRCADNFAASVLRDCQ